jgi:hypothetical protein
VFSDPDEDASQHPGTHLCREGTPAPLGKDSNELLLKVGREKTALSLFRFKPPYLWLINPIKKPFKRKC